MSVARSFRQRSPYASGVRSVINTAWVYPIIDVEYVLATTALPFTRVGNVITCPDVSGCIALGNAFFSRTTVKQPDGNPGYALGVRTFLTDQGKDLFLKVPPGETVMQYRLLKQVSPQEDPPVTSPAPDTPNDTIGYGMVFTSFGTNAGTAGELFYIDPIRYVRVG